MVDKTTIYGPKVTEILQISVILAVFRVKNSKKIAKKNFFQKKFSQCTHKWFSDILSHMRLSECSFPAFWYVLKSKISYQYANSWNSDHFRWPKKLNFMLKNKILFANLNSTSKNLIVQFACVKVFFPWLTCTSNTAENALFCVNIADSHYSRYDPQNAILLTCEDLWT